MKNKGSIVELISQVVPFNKCSLGMEEQHFTTTRLVLIIQTTIMATITITLTTTITIFRLVPKLFVEKGCTQGKKTIPHTKLLPECRNVTKQNCVTLWETDADGKQVIILDLQITCSTTVILTNCPGVGWD